MWSDFRLSDLQIHNRTRNLQTQPRNHIVSGLAQWSFENSKCILRLSLFKKNFSFHSFFLESSKQCLCWTRFLLFHRDMNFVTASHEEKISNCRTCAKRCKAHHYGCKICFASLTHDECPSQWLQLSSWFSRQNNSPQSQHYWKKKIHGADSSCHYDVREALSDK